MNYRFATIEHVRLLAPMNHRLIRDEGHRNTMTVSQLEERMAGWLTGQYEAVLTGSNACVPHRSRVGDPCYDAS